MRRAAEKLKSRRGASIVLALLFLLLCVMVGVSILAAAASNAGRTPSNRDEQQIYLALSSSLRLVVDDLTDSTTSYTGKAVYDCSVDPVYQDPTDPTSTLLGHNYTYTFKPAEGEMTGAFMNIFRPYLDEVFETYLASHFGSALGSGTSGWYYYDGTFTSHSPTPDFILTVTPDGPLDGYEAKIHVTISDTFRITMRASLSALPDDDTSKHYNDYWMETTLSLVDSSLPELQKPTDGSAGSNFEAQIDNAKIKWKPDVIHSGYGTP